MPRPKPRSFKPRPQEVKEEDVKPQIAKDKPTDRKAQREKKKFDFEKNSRTVFVGNLPNTMDQKSLSKLFSDCGQVESCRIRSIFPEKEKLAPKVALITKRMHLKVDSFNGYVVFKTNENDECVKKALALNGRLVEKHHIRVDRAQKPLSKKMTLTSRKKSIFVGNLRFDIREDDLINHFSQCGAVNHVRIVRDRATGMGKGFAFVAFDERAPVKEALDKLNGTKYKGRELRIKKVEDEKDKKGKGKKIKQENKVVDES